MWLPNPVFICDMAHVLCHLSCVKKYVSYVIYHDVENLNHAMSNIPYVLQGQFSIQTSMSQFRSLCIVHNVHLVSLHCGTIQRTQAQLIAAVNAQLGFENQPPPKRLFLTAFSKNNGQIKIEKLGTWKKQYLVQKFVALLYCFISGYTRITPYVPKMPSKLTSSYLSSNFHEWGCPLVAAFETFPVVS